MKRDCPLLLALWLASFSASAQTNFISGSITSNLTLSGTNVIQGAVLVSRDAVLTILPGTKMLMASGATLLIEGQLLADGFRRCAHPFYPPNLRHA